jgi:hypothetical protein
MEQAHIKAVDNENLYKKPVVLYFGSCAERLQEVLDKRAIAWDKSLEFVAIENFNYLVQKYLESEDDEDRNYFDLICYIYSEIDYVKSPKVTIGTYLHNGFKYPTLIFEDGYLLDINREKRFFLRDDVIDKIGRAIADHIEYEFIEFKRID